MSKTWLLRAEAHDQRKKQKQSIATKNFFSAAIARNTLMAKGSSLTPNKHCFSGIYCPGLHIIDQNKGSQSDDSRMHTAISLAGTSAARKQIGGFCHRSYHALTDSPTERRKTRRRMTERRMTERRKTGRRMTVHRMPMVRQWHSSVVKLLPV